jgi:uncharacterized membrane protein YadS
VVKLTRTLMIIPVTFILALRQSKKERDAGGSFTLRKTFPWFVAAFLLGFCCSFAVVLVSLLLQTVIRMV